VLSAPPSALIGADLYAVLRACPGLGRERVRAIIERSDVWPHKRLGELNERERSALVRELEK
jgi:ribosomal protein S13